MQLIDFLRKNKIKAIAIAVAIIAAIIVIAVNQTNVTNSQNEIEKLISEGNYEQAIELLGDLADSKDKYIQIADCQLALNQNENALRSLELALKEAKYSEKSEIKDRISEVNELIDQTEAQQSEKISLSDLCERCASNSNFEEQYKNKYFEFKVTAYFDKYEIKNKQEEFSSSVKFNEKHDYELICEFASEETMKQVPDGATASIKGKFTKLVYNTLYFEDCEVVSFKKAEQTTSTTPEITSAPVTETEPIQTTASQVTPFDNVYIAASGKGTKYHNNRYCSGMDGNVIEISKEEAKSSGYSACGRCY